MTSLERAGQIAATGSQEGKVRARGYWEQVWRRFKRDRVALASIFFLVMLVIVVYPGAWIAESFSTRWLRCEAPCGRPLRTKRRHRIC